MNKQRSSAPSLYDPKLIHVNIFVKANADKCHLLVSSHESCTAKIEDFSIKNGTEEKLLGVKF